MCQNLSERLMRLRGLLGLSETEFARDLRIDPKTLKAWREGGTPQPATRAKAFDHLWRTHPEKLKQLELTSEAFVFDVAYKKVCAKVPCPPTTGPEIQAPAPPASAEGPRPVEPPAARPDTERELAHLRDERDALKRGRRRARGALALLCAVGVAAAAAAIRSRQAGRTQGAAREARYQFLYGEIFRSGGDVLLSLSRPAVYKYLIEAEAQSSPVTGDAGAGRLPIQELARPRSAFKNIILTKTQYTGLGEALTALRVYGLFAELGRAGQLKIGPAPPGDTEGGAQSAVLLGGWVSHPVADRYFGNSDQLAFHIRDAVYGRGAAAAAVCRPAYQVSADVTVRDELYPSTECGLITKVMSPNDRREVWLAVAGVGSQGTEAAGHLITDDAERLRSWLEHRFGTAIPSQFQVVFAVTVLPNGRPTRRYSFCAAEDVLRPAGARDPGARLLADGQPDSPECLPPAAAAPG
jgi:hypothetical protein